MDTTLKREESNMTILSIILGVLMLIVGISCLFTPLATMLAAGYIVGILLLVYGIANIIRAITEKGDALEWIMSILAIIVGIVAIVRPGGTLALDTVIVYLLAAFFLIEGVIQIVLSIKTKGVNKNWVPELISGILFLLLGILSFANPTFAAVTVGVLISFFFIVTGISLITLGMAGGAED